MEFQNSIKIFFQNSAFFVWFSVSFVKVYTFKISDDAVKKFLLTKRLEKHTKISLRNPTLAHVSLC